MARKKRDYSDFVQYAKEHKNLTEKQIYTSFISKENGGHIRKQTALELTRDIFGFEKREKVGRTIHQKENTAKAKPYEYYYAPSAPKVREKKERKPRLNKAKNYKRDYVFFNDRDRTQTNYVDLHSKFVQGFKKNIKKMYGYTENEYVQIGVSIAGDDYTKGTNFTVIYPYDGKAKSSIKKVGMEILNNLSIFYNNLAKKYKNTTVKSSTVLEDLKKCKKEFSPFPYPRKDDMVNIFARYGIEVHKFGLLVFTDNKPKTK